MTSVSEVARDFQRTMTVAIPNGVSEGQRSQLQAQVTNMQGKIRNKICTFHMIFFESPFFDKLDKYIAFLQGSIWEYSDSQPWFLVGLRKNNPTATRQALESLMQIYPPPVDPLKQDKKRKRRGTVSINDGRDTLSNLGQEDAIPRVAASINSNISAGDQDKHVVIIDTNLDVANIHPPDWEKESHSGDSTKVGTVTAEETANRRHFIGPHGVKIVIKKTVELVNDMEKSTELVFHAVRASARFLTYPTPSIPSDNFVLGHVKGWLWLIYKGISHFNADQADRKELDLYMKIFRKEMSLLAKEVNGCADQLSGYARDLRKLNIGIRREAKALRKRNKRHIWAFNMNQYFRFLDELKQKPDLLVDVHQDRFFPTEWIFEPHPSQTKLQWDFFHFQWVNLRRDWVDCEFELRSDYSLHWQSYHSYTPELQVEIIVHIIQHLKAVIEEVHQFHRDNLHLSFDIQEVKFLKYAIDEVATLKKHRDAVEFTICSTRKLFEDLALLEKVSGEYLVQMEWLVEVIEPCYHTAMHKWLTEELILPLEFSARRRRHQKWFNCCFFRRRRDFLEIFGDNLQVVLMRSPISLDQLQKFFPDKERLNPDTLLGSSAINSYGISRGYTSSIFDAGLGRDKPLPIHHPLPKYRRRQEQKYNIFDIHRLIEATVDCLVPVKSDKLGGSSDHKMHILMDVDIEKYLVVIEETHRFLLAFASIFNFMTADLKERVEMLESHLYSHLPEHYGTLEKMIFYETQKQMDNTDSSGTRAFARLHKIFQFVVYFLEKASALEETEITYYACKAAYYKSYAKVQSWIYQKAATFSMYSLPNKQDMFASLFTENEKPYVEARTKEFIEQGAKLIESCETILKIRNIVIQ